MLGREELNTGESEQLEDAIEIANDLEAIGDLIGTNLVAQGRRRLEQKVEISETRLQAIRPLYEAVIRAMDDVRRALTENDKAGAKRRFRGRKRFGNSPSRREKALPRN